MRPEWRDGVAPMGNVMGPRQDMGRLCDNNVDGVKDEIQNHHLFYYEVRL